ncbi:unnamed protein product [Clonostachys byssicola]|uniref:DUF1446 domain-containing protein n=1 Tax=Clonostachys byssicola TaxID=160290 RepID=A0A9N9XV84_9HYPO|nr:unnamed protein product [Clonostachys byssicola]
MASSQQERPRRPIRIGNASGAIGDGIDQVFRLASSGDVDAITADYLAEFNIAWKAIELQTNLELGYEPNFLEQLAWENGAGAKAVARNKVKVVHDGGALNPKGLAKKVDEYFKSLGISDVKVAWIEGDNVTEQVKSNKLVGLRHLDQKDVTFSNSDEAPTLAANVYTGQEGIVKALEAGADIVICGRCCDASPVMGLATWWHGWGPSDYDPLAGSLMAGHLIECGAYVTGGNYCGAREVPELHHVGYPIAEISCDGTTVITKSDGSNGAVTVDTCTAQLLYEIQGQRYLNPDVTAFIGQAKLEQVGPSRVKLSGITGLPPPETSKVAICQLGGYQAEISAYAAGLDTDFKFNLMKSQVLGRVNMADFSIFSIEKYGSSLPDPRSQKECTVQIRMFAQSPNKEAFSQFRRAIFYNGMQGYCGLHLGMDWRTMEPKPYVKYFPALISRNSLPDLSVKFVSGEVFAVPSRKGTPIRSITSLPSPEQSHPSVLDTSNAMVVRPLGDLLFARSGDKGGNANVGFWVRSEKAYPWARKFLTSAKLVELLADDWDDRYTVERCEFPHLRAIHFVIKGILQEVGDESLCGIILLGLITFYHLLLLNITLHLDRFLLSTLGLVHLLALGKLLLLALDEVGLLTLLGHLIALKELIVELTLEEIILITLVQLVVELALEKLILEVTLIEIVIKIALKKVVLVKVALKKVLIELIALEEILLVVTLPEVVLIALIQLIVEVALVELIIEVTLEKLVIKVALIELIFEVTLIQILLITLEQLVIEVAFVQVILFGITFEQLIIEVSLIEFIVEVTFEQLVLEVALEEFIIELTLEQLIIEVAFIQVILFEVTFEQLVIEVSLIEFIIEVTCIELVLEVALVKLVIEVTFKQLVVEVSLIELIVKVSLIELIVKVTLVEFIFEIAFVELVIEITLVEFVIKVSLIEVVLIEVASIQVVLIVEVTLLEVILKGTGKVFLNGFENLALVKILIAGVKTIGFLFEVAALKFATDSVENITLVALVELVVKVALIQVVFIEVTSVELIIEVALIEIILLEVTGVELVVEIALIQIILKIALIEVLVEVSLVELVIEIAFIQIVLIEVTSVELIFEVTLIEFVIEIALEEFIVEITLVQVVLIEVTSIKIIFEIAFIELIIKVALVKLVIEIPLVEFIIEVTLVEVVLVEIALEEFIIEITFVELVVEVTLIEIVFVEVALLKLIVEITLVQLVIKVALVKLVVEVTLVELIVEIALEEVVLIKVTFEEIVLVRTAGKLILDGVNQELALGNVGLLIVKVTLEEEVILIEGSEGEFFLDLVEEITLKQLVVEVAGVDILVEVTLVQFIVEVTLKEKLLVVKVALKEVILVEVSFKKLIIEFTLKEKILIIEVALKELVIEVTFVQILFFSALGKFHSFLGAFLDIPLDVGHPAGDISLSKTNVLLVVFTALVHEHGLGGHSLAKFFLDGISEDLKLALVVSVADLAGGLASTTWSEVLTRLDGSIALSQVAALLNLRSRNAGAGLESAGA